MLKFSEVLQMDAKTIDAKVSDLRKQLFEARMMKAASGFDKPHLLKEYKRTIARLLTVKTRNSKKQ